MYVNGRTVAGDIHVGEKFSRQYADFVPVVQLFLGKQDDKIIEKTKLFSEETWQTVAEKADTYVKLYPDCAHDGFFYFK